MSASLRAITGGRQTPPLFFTRLSPKDRERLDRLMEGHRFDPSIIAGVAARCRFGQARVLVCLPLSRALRPFPTTFWLVCPWLIRRAGTVESEGGVRGLESRLSLLKLQEWRAYSRLHQLLRLSFLPPRFRDFLRRFHPGLFRAVRLGGAGGIRPAGEVRVKCLHLQAASWLALGRHPGAEWLRDKGLDGECEGYFCL